jgi:hypothetical protein
MPASGLYCLHLLYQHMMYSKENRSLFVISGEFGLEVNAEESMYMFMSYQHYVGQNYSMKDS